MQAASASYLQIQAANLLRGTRVRDLMSANYLTVSRGTSLQDLVHEVVFRTGGRCFLVIEDGRLLGLITPDEIRAFDPSRWPQTTVQEAMRPASSVAFVSPDLPVMRGLEIMTRENINQLPVVADGKIQGIISRAHVLQVLQTKTELAPPELKKQPARDNFELRILNFDLKTVHVKMLLVLQIKIQNSKFKIVLLRRLSASRWLRPVPDPASRQWERRDGRPRVGPKFPVHRN